MEVGDQEVGVADGEFQRRRRFGYDVQGEDSASSSGGLSPVPAAGPRGALPEKARAAVSEAVGSAMAVDVRLVWDPPWRPAMIPSRLRPWPCLLSGDGAPARPDYRRRGREPRTPGHADPQPGR